MYSLTSSLTAAQKAGGKRLSRIVLTFTPSAWVANTAYTEGERVEPTAANTYLYQCTAAGTSAASEPTWPTTVGGTVADGTVTWTNIGLKSQTYTRAGSNPRIISINPHTESVISQRATVILDNSDKALTDRDFKGFKGVISYGYNTSAGDEYQARPSLWVISQNNYSLQSGRAITSLELIGIPDQLANDKASDDYEPDTTNTDTVKTIVVAILGATLSVFDHCQAYTAANSKLIIDWEDALFDSFTPKDSLRIRFGESRLDVLNRLLSWTKMAWRAEAGEEIHLQTPYNIEDKETWQASHAYEYDDVVEPTTPNGYVYTPETEGTSAGSEPTWPTGIGDTVVDNTVTWLVAYHYDYTLTAGDHNFFDHNSRERIVIPGYVKVESFPDADPAAQYSGTAQDDAYDTYPTELKIQDFRRMRVASNAEAGNIATAILRSYQLHAEKGGTRVPMNVGQEVLDYIYVSDGRTGDSRTGIIQHLTFYDTPTTFEMEFSFAPYQRKPSLKMRQPLEDMPAQVSPAQILYLQDIIIELATIVDERLDAHDRLIQYNWETNYFGDKTVIVRVVAQDTTLTTGDGKDYWVVSSILNGWLLVDADAAVDTASTSGLPTFQIHNLTDTVDMLTTLITIDINEKNSFTAATQPVIDQTKDDVATGDVIRFDCDVAGTGTKGLSFILRFRRP